MSGTPRAANQETNAGGSSTRYVARSAQIASRVLGDEVMIMSAKDSTLYSLNEVATVIWEAADGATPLEQIVTEKVCGQFDVPRETALRDAEVLVEQLAGHGILILSEKPIELPGVGEESR
jgi:hypothetical protein